MGLEDGPDESLLRMHGSIREQVSADRYSGSSHRFLPRDAQQRAEALESELRRRGVQFQLTDWS
jgi:hypothetical protein